MPKLNDEHFTPEKPENGTTIGIAINNIKLEPINGLRLKPANGTNGWYIWCGNEMKSDKDFFSPLHIEHISEYLPEVEKYLDLPPGYRFQIDRNGYEDVWIDEDLIKN